MRGIFTLYCVMGLYLLSSVGGAGAALGAAGSPGRDEALVRSVERARNGSSHAEQDREVQVPLRAEAGGLWVTAQLGKGSSIQMMVDTGASVVVLPEGLARAAGVAAGGTEVTLQTLHGQVRGRGVELPLLAVGGARASRVKAVVVPDGQLSFALLGRSFLSRFRVSIDLDLQQLILTPRSEGVSAAGPSSGGGPAEYTEAHVERLQNELIRALRDPSSSPAYLRSLQSALAQWEQKRSR